MNKSYIISAITLASILSLSLTSTTAFAQETAIDGSGESVPISQVTIQQFRPPVDCAVDSGDIIAWDTSKGVDPSGSSTLVSTLESNGFVVREVDISTQGIPSCIVKLVITELMANNFCITTPYSAAEGTLISNWVNSGGAVYVLSEGVGCGQGSSSQVSGALGETLIPSSIFSNPFLPNINFNPLNPLTLFQGINSFDFIFSSTFSPSPNTVTTYDSGQPALLAKAFGQGCVLLSGDSSHIHDLGIINDVDNLLFGLNAFLFLNQCFPSDVDAVGGEIIPLDTTMVLAAGAQYTAAWMIPVIVSGIGFAIVIARKF
jgi:hypothetical protein